MIHPASAGEERKQSWSSGIGTMKSSKRKEANRVEGLEPKSSALCGADQSSVPRGLRWQSQPSSSRPNFGKGKDKEGLHSQLQKARKGGGGILRFL